MQIWVGFGLHFTHIVRVALKECYGLLFVLLFSNKSTHDRCKEQIC